MGKVDIYETLHHRLISSTTVDRDNEKLSLNALQSIYEQIPETQLMGQAHNASLPPVAIMYNKSIEETDDGEHAIFADIDVYSKEALEEYDGFSISYTTGEETPGLESRAALEILYNPKYHASEIASDFSQLSEAEYRVDVIELKQKSVELITASVILKFGVASLAAGLLAKVGSDIWDLFKKIVKDLVEKRMQDTGGDTVLHFMYPYDADSYDYELVLEVKPERLENFELEGVNFDSLHEYLESKIGDSKVKKVAVEMTETSPFWNLLWLVDSDNRVIMA